MEKLNPRQRKFAELVATGIPAGRAYEQAGYDSRGTDADANAARLIANDKVSRFVQSLRWEAETESKKATILTIQQKREFLARVVQTPIGTVDEDSDLCQAFKLGESTREIKMPDKLRAIELDSRLAGEFRDSVKIDASDEIVSLLKSIRGAK